MIKVSKIEVGSYLCNCYLVDNGKECLLIDPGDDYLDILKFIKGKNIIGILITHSHFDHVGCVLKLVKEFGYPVYSNENLKEGIFKLGSFSLEVIKTYGHTLDCLSFYFKEDKIMFTGDFLFYRTIGRCDFEESNYDMMLESLVKISKYDDDIIIYPGHGQASILGEEKMYNSYFF